MDYTPFSRDKPFAEIARAGAVYVATPGQADIILSRRPRHLRDFGHYPKRFVIWTDEPRFSLEQSPRSPLAGVCNIADVMNAHTGTLYGDNYHHLWGHRKPVDFDERMHAFTEKPDRACMIATYRRINESRERNHWSGPLKIRDVNIDLNQTRQELAISLYRRGYCDIYGMKWPAEIQVSGESRLGNWAHAKRELMSRYVVNIAMESTIAPNYVTEKIWDSVREAALPVYHSGKGSIYDDFPRGSFIEAAGKDIGGLADEIHMMPKSERTDRYETCLRTYVKIVADDRFVASRNALHLRIADFIEEIMSRPPEISPKWTITRGLRASIRATLRPPSASTR